MASSGATYELSILLSSVSSGASESLPALRPPYNPRFFIFSTKFLLHPVLHSNHFLPTQQFLHNFLTSIAATIFRVPGSTVSLRSDAGDSDASVSGVSVHHLAQAISIKPLSSRTS
ncbi:hypothetical protein BU25DRAFT_93062 [Macroventuria anomochaeta]|uniref:Uncharacterized protein n=1 Tax=Macroventuria anomochaeta TaxID=301207 RepID=A0ACB6S0P6_9PLEO|nr:uncharacterized protein BU25DRAFT_93062 [Macroventuria anomochaeta]KAF2626707.1 hypothetical protein BU25DRAFT_93062 [Macroventuria anomochaeta]